jgi:hypothetical protein
VAAKAVRKMVEKVWNNVQRYTGNATIYINMRAYGSRGLNTSLTFFYHHR